MNKKKTKFRLTKMKVIVGLLLVGIVLAGAATLFLRSRGTSPEKLLSTGEMYFEEGKYPESKFVFEKLLMEESDNQRAFARLGKIWLDEGSPFRALSFLTRANELDPSDLETRLNLAYAWLGVRAKGSAQEQIRAILEVSSDHDEAVLLLASLASEEAEIAEVEKLLPESMDADSAMFRLARAQLESSKGDPDALAGLLESAVKIDPDSVHAHIAMGNYHFSQKEMESAEIEFGKAATLAESRSSARLRYAEFKIATRALDEARGALEEIVGETPDFLNAWMLLANLSISEGDTEKAMGHLGKIFAHDPTHFAARFLEGQVLIMQGESAKAVELLESLNQTKPLGDSPGVNYQLARAYLLDGTPSRAVAVLERALEKNPNYAEAKLLLARLKLASGETQEVVSLMGSLVSERPELLQAQLLLADALQRLGRGDDAAAVFRARVEKAPEDPQAHVFLGMLLRQQRKLVEARAEFSKAAELVPENPLPQLRLLELDVAEKNFESALKRAQELIDKSPESASARAVIGQVHRAAGAQQEAQKAFTKAIELDPELISAYTDLAGLFAADGKYKEAAEHLETAFLKSPEDLRLQSQLAIVYSEMGEFEKARDSYEAIIKHAPDSGPVYNNLAVLYSEHLSDPDRAAEAAQKARSLLPDDPSIADTFGWITYKKADYKSALALLREAAGGLPDDPVVLYHLGMANYMMGELEGARAALGKAVASKDEFDGKEIAQQRLDSIDAVQTLEELAAAVKASPEDVIARMRLARTQEQKGMSKDAAASYLAASQANPDLAEAKIGLARLHAGPLDDKELALKYAKEARSIASEDLMVAAALGKIAFQLGEFGWSHSLYQQGALATGKPEDIHDFAQAAYSLGKVPEARGLMERVVSSAPTSEAAGRAKLFLQLTNDSAIADGTVVSVLQDDPNNVPALMLRATIDQRDGKNAPAESSLRKVLTIYPNFAPAQRDLAALLTKDPERLLDAKRLEEVHSLATMAREALRDDPMLARTLAVVSYFQKKFPLAIQLFESQASSLPLDAEALFYLGMSYLQVDNGEEARKSLEAAIKAGLDDDRARQAREAISEAGEQ